jgi:nicotinamidase-related amidase
MSDANLPRPALVLVDFQRGFESTYWGKRNNPGAETRALDLLAAFRQHSAPIFHVRHLSLEPGSPLSGAGATFKPGFEPRAGEALVEKTVNSAFIGTSLESGLRRLSVTDIVLCGLTTPHCVSTTTRMAGNLGFTVHLAADACAAFTRNADCSFDEGAPYTAEEIHRAALSHLHGEFATVAAAPDCLSAVFGGTAEAG